MSLLLNKRISVFREVIGDELIVVGVVYKIPPL